MTKYVVPEILRNSNGLYLFFTGELPKERFAALSKMQSDLQNDGYPQYSGDDRRRLVDYVNIHAELMGEVMNNLAKMP